LQAQFDLQTQLMTTSWKKIQTKLKESGMINQMERRQSRIFSRNDESGSEADNMTTYSSTPLSSTPVSNKQRNSIDSEWQLNYMIINRNDGL
jgi:hypothetical protein